MCGGSKSDKNDGDDQDLGLDGAHSPSSWYRPSAFAVDDPMRLSALATTASDGFGMLITTPAARGGAGAPAVFTFVPVWITGGGHAAEGPSSTTTPPGGDGVSGDRDGGAVSVEDKPRGGGMVIRGHLARANPQWQSFDGRTEAVIVFSGPHCYISPNWYAVCPQVLRVGLACVVFTMVIFTSPSCCICCLARSDCCQVRVATHGPYLELRCGGRLRKAGGNSQLGDQGGGG